MDPLTEASLRNISEGADRTLLSLSIVRSEVQSLRLRGVANDDELVLALGAIESSALRQAIDLLATALQRVSAGAERLRSGMSADDVQSDSAEDRPRSELCSERQDSSLRGRIAREMDALEDE